jgi:hypothetical protein
VGLDREGDQDAAGRPAAGGREDVEGPEAQERKGEAMNQWAHEGAAVRVERTEPVLDPRGQAVQTVADLLAAVALIEADGWNRETLGDGPGACLLTALRRVTGDAPFGCRYLRARDAVRRVLGLGLTRREYDEHGRPIEGAVHTIAEWHEESGRTEVQVLTALRNAAWAVQAVAA